MSKQNKTNKKERIEVMEACPTDLQFELYKAAEKVPDDQYIFMLHCQPSEERKDHAQSLCLCKPNNKEMGQVLARNMAERPEIEGFVFRALAYYLDEHDGRPASQAFIKACANRHGAKVQLSHGTYDMGLELGVTLSDEEDADGGRDGNISAHIHGSHNMLVQTVLHVLRDNKDFREVFEEAFAQYKAG